FRLSPFEGFTDSIFTSGVPTDASIPRLVTTPIFVPRHEHSEIAAQPLSDGDKGWAVTHFCASGSLSTFFTLPRPSIRLARLALEIDSYCWCSTVTEPSSFVVTTAMMESLRKYLIFSEDILLSLVTVASRYDIAHCCQWAIA